MRDNSLGLASGHGREELLGSVGVGPLRGGRSEGGDASVVSSGE